MFSWFRSKPEEPVEEETEGGEEAEAEKSNKKKIIIAVLIAIALLLLILLIVLIVLLTRREEPKSEGNSTQTEMLNKRRQNVEGGGMSLGADNGSMAENLPPGMRPIDCPLQPPSPHGMVRTWDGLSHWTGVTIGYKCDQDPDEEQIMMVVCVDKHWKTLYQKTDSCMELLHSRKCLGDPLPATDKVPFDWDYQARNVGTRVIYRCSPAKGSPIMRILVCTRDYEWRIFSDTTDKCMCGKPLHYAPPIKYEYEHFDGKLYKPGTTVHYFCDAAMQNHFLTITCLQNATWQVTKNGNCFFLVEKTLNYTDSIKYCNQMGGEIKFIKNSTEQDAVKSLLSSHGKFDSTCANKAFLGIYEDVSRQWRSTDGQFVSGISDLFQTVDEARKQCVAIQRQDGYKLNNVLCSGLHLCPICEYGKNVSNPECPSTEGTCYLIKTNVGTYNASQKHCQSDGGQLALIVTMKQLAKAKDMLVKNSALAQKCEAGLYVGLRSMIRYYMTHKNEEAPFTKFVDETRRSMNKHCVVVYEKTQYKWVDEYCRLPCCFMCKMDGYPIGSFTPSDHKFVPTLPQQALSARAFDNFSHHATLMKPRGFSSRVLDLASVACDNGWVTDGFHCFLFNDTLVTNYEARQFCKSQYGTLASLVTPFERNFIIDHLMTRYNDPKRGIPKVWHVDSTGGLPSDNSNKKSRLKPPPSYIDPETCVSIHLRPRIGWAVIDCNYLAAFICHD